MFNSFLGLNMRKKSKNQLYRISKTTRKHLNKCLLIEHLESREMLSILTLTWTGQNTDYWNNNGNWSGGVTGHRTPQTGDSLIFGSGSSTSVNDMPTNPWLNSILVYYGFSIWSNDINHPIQMMGPIGIRRSYCINHWVYEYYRRQYKCSSRFWLWIDNKCQYIRAVRFL